MGVRSEWLVATKLPPLRRGHEVSCLQSPPPAVAWKPSAARKVSCSTQRGRNLFKGERSELPVGPKLRPPRRDHEVSCRQSPPPAVAWLPSAARKVSRSTQRDWKLENVPAFSQPVTRLTGGGCASWQETPAACQPTFLDRQAAAEPLPRRLPAQVRLHRCWCWNVFIELIYWLS